MPESDDISLLREYVDNDSESAFASLVTRHINKVYAVALRHTRNVQQAEEITQAVFVILAQKARRFGKGVVLSGWLYQTARLTALTLVRSEIRRTRRQQEAQMQTELNKPEADVWSQVMPLLDSAMAGLSEKDRHAVVLRFFDDKSLKEVGTALGGSEEAAKRRVHRAVEKLRHFFARHGVVVSSAVLMTAIAANSVQAAPANLAPAATALALAKGATASATTSILISAAKHLMAWTKAKTAIGAAAALMLAGTATTLLLRAAASSQAGRGSGLEVVAAERTTPRGTMLVMTRALESGDANSYLECFSFTTTEEEQLKPALQSFVAATARFNRALREKFGVDQAHQAFPNMAFVIPTNLVQSAQEEIHGERATVVLTGGKAGRPIDFVRTNGEWKMSVSGFIHLSPTVMKDLYERVIRAMDETLQEIPGNKFAAAIEAVDRMKERAR